MKTVALFADVGNLYYCIGKRYEGRKLDYQKLFHYVSEFGFIQRAFAYGSQIGEEANPFITCLKKIGYDTKYKRPRTADDDARKVVRKADWDVGIAMDVVRMHERIDTIVICSADPDLVPIVEWAKEKGIRCIVIACGIAKELKAVADQAIEIPEDLLEEVRVTAA